MSNLPGREGGAAPEHLRLSGRSGARRELETDHARRTTLGRPGRRHRARSARRNCDGRGVRRRGRAAAPQPGSKPAAAATEPAQLSPAQVRAQIAAAEALRRRLQASSAAMSAATRRLERLATRSSGLLSTLAAARDAERAASAEHTAQQRRLDVLATQVAAEKTRIGHWAHDSYVSGGGSLSTLAATMHLLASRSPEDSSDGLAVLGYLADEQGRAYDHLKTLLGAQDDATAKASAAARRAQDAAAAALAAKTAFDRSVAEQRAALTRFRAARPRRSARPAGCAVTCCAPAAPPPALPTRDWPAPCAPTAARPASRRGRTAPPATRGTIPTARCRPRRCARCTAPPTSACARTPPARSTR